tara:strand:+ start:463 stop:810 length:348 start_codon:yes stop_codon:yes gene_type:complete
MNKTDARFELFQSSNKTAWFFRLKANEWQMILHSEGYTTKAACLNGVESVRKNSQREGAYDKKESTNGKYYFNLLAANHQSIGRSQLYESKQGLKNCIVSVKKNAPVAEIIDLTE